jgi:hypothetical protein
MDNQADIVPCLCGKTPKVQTQKKPQFFLFIECCKHRVEVRPAFETEVYIESAKDNLIKTWNHAMNKRRPPDDSKSQVS